MQVEENQNLGTLIIFKDNFEPARISFLNQKGAFMWANRVLPITVSDATSAYVFTGSSDTEEDSYSGKVKILQSGAIGSWQLKKLGESSDEISASMKADLHLWLLLKSEQNDVTEKLTKYVDLISSQRNEIQKLIKFITDRETLRTNADKKLNAERNELLALQNKFAQRQQEVRKLEKQVELAYRVTPMGKLVSLSRESLERDGRWIDSMLKSVPSDMDIELTENQIAEAEKVLSLKKQIELENEKIYKLLHPEEQQSLQPGEYR